MDIRLFAARGTSTSASDTVIGNVTDFVNDSANDKNQCEAKNKPHGDKRARAVMHRRRSLTREPHSSTTQSLTRNTTSKWRGGVVVLTVKPTAPCTYLTEEEEEGDKGHPAPMPATVQIVPHVQPRERQPK